MSNPWSDIYRDLRAPYLQEKKAKKDYDGDGKIESGTDEYMGSKDKAIKKAMGKSVKEGSYDNTYSDNTGKESAEKKKKLEKKRGMKLPNHPQFKKEEKEDAPRMQKGAMAYDGPNKASSEAKDRVFAKTKKKMTKEHHTKDENGKIIEHDDTSPASVEEGAPYTVNVADKTGNTPAWQGYVEGKLNQVTGEPLYVAGEDIQELNKDSLGRMKLTAADVRLNSGAFKKSLKDINNKVYSPVINKAHYEPEGEVIESTPAKVRKPNFSNWREDFVWQDEVEEAIKRPKLDIQEKGVKNKVEINPDDGLKESEKKN